MDTRVTPGWRLINNGFGDCHTNMAIDETLLRSFDPATSAPVLRLYGWDPPALSMGRFQKAGQALNLERCNVEGVPVVRRITGGGVIYHADELTYSIVCSPEQIPSTTSLKDSFRILTRFLLNFYKALGLDASYAQDAAPAGYRLGARTDFCFAGRESFDILINGRKIGGNAQRRQRNVIFQHGSIPLSNQVETGLTFMRGNFSGCEQGVVSLAECGVLLDRNKLLAEIISAFSNSFAIEFDDYVLFSDEIIMSNNLKNNKYVADSWNLGGVGG